MAFKFPFTNYHELNLTWILDQLKALFEQSEENVTTIETYEDRLTAVETELPSVSETASEASRAAAAAGALAQTAKATADTAQNNAIQAQSLAGTARQEAQNAQTAADAATQAAQQAQATTQNFDGRITQAENDASHALEASRSFENRVQSAITTANNASQTATNAQGIAMRADQNAGAALDKIGDLSALDTTAKQNLVVAINTVKTALDGKQNAPTAAGTAGQVLGLNSALEPVWIDQTGGDSEEGYNKKEIELVKALLPYEKNLSLGGGLLTVKNNCVEFRGGSGTSYYNTVLTNANVNTWKGTANEIISHLTDADFIPVPDYCKTPGSCYTLNYAIYSNYSGTENIFDLRIYGKKDDVITYITTLYTSNILARPLRNIVLNKVQEAPYSNYDSIAIIAISRSRAASRYFILYFTVQTQYMDLSSTALSLSN